MLGYLDLLDEGTVNMFGHKSMLIPFVLHTVLQKNFHLIKLFVV